jgi:transcriptional regulator with XRE-family HTH domain
MKKSVHTRAYQALLEALVEGRDAADLTQTELGKRLGRRQSFMSKVEAGERRLDVIEFLLIMRELKLKAEDVIKVINKAL